MSFNALQHVQKQIERRRVITFTDYEGRSSTQTPADLGYVSDINVVFGINGIDVTTDLLEAIEILDDDPHYNVEREVYRESDDVVVYRVTVSNL